MRHPRANDSAATDHSLSATSNDPWGPTGTEMSEIAQLTFNGYSYHPLSSPALLSLVSSNDFYEIMDMLDKRMNDKGKNWRHVLKSLKVLDYCLHEGSELVVTWARKNVYIIKTLREFQYVDDDGKDVGQNGEQRYVWRFRPELMKTSTSLRKRTYIISPG